MGPKILKLFRLGELCVRLPGREKLPLLVPMVRFTQKDDPVIGVWFEGDTYRPSRIRDGSKGDFLGRSVQEVLGLGGKPLVLVDGGDRIYAVFSTFSTNEV